MIIVCSELGGHGARICCLLQASRPRVVMSKWGDAFVGPWWSLFVGALVIAEPVGEVRLFHCTPKWCLSRWSINVITPATVRSRFMRRNLAQAQAVGRGRATKRREVVGTSTSRESIASPSIPARFLFHWVEGRGGRHTVKLVAIEFKFSSGRIAHTGVGKHLRGRGNAAAVVDGHSRQLIGKFKRIHRDCCRSY